MRWVPARLPWAMILYPEGGGSVLSVQPVPGIGVSPVTRSGLWLPGPVCGI